MLRKFLLGKIHRATVTQCEVDYVGSITIDGELLRAAGIRPNEMVLVGDFSNGNRFETYVVEGEPGSGIIGVNGAAGLLTEPGHKLIICAFAQLDEKEIDGHAAKVVIVDDRNRIAQRLSYRTTLREAQLTE